jgi:hypothetical protein
MPTLLEILRDPNYINANPATKQAIFDKYAPQDNNYLEANDATKAAIRQRFGLGVVAPAAKREYGTPIETPPEDKEGFIPALKAGYQSLKGSAALTAGKLGLMDPREAERYRAEREAEAERVFTPTEKGWTEAPITKTAELLGGSLPYMAAPVAAAATVATLPVTGPAGVALSLGATGLVSATQFTGTNLARQLDENKRTNPNAGLESTNLGSAVAAAIPQAALDIIGMKAIPLVRGLFKSAGKEVTEQQAKNIAEQGFRRTLADYSLATGKAAGIEGTTEVGQQFLERLQAGLNIADASARKEYVDSFIGGAVLGGAISPAGRYIERRGEAKTSEERDALDTLQAKIDAEQLEQAKKELQTQAAAVSPEAVAGRASELVGEAPSAADVLTAAQQAVSEQLGEQAPVTPEQKVAEATAKVDEVTSRINELTDEYIAAGIEPDKAKIQAAAQVAEEEKNDQEVEQAQAEIAKVQAEAAKEVEDVAKTIEQSGGESVPIPSEPAGGVPTVGVEPPVTERVERAAPVVEEPVRREEAPSGAIEEKPKQKPAIVNIDEKGRGTAFNESVLAGTKGITADSDMGEDYPSRVGAVMITGIDRQAGGQKGRASEVLKTMTDWADANNKQLVLMPAASGDLKKDDLISWYSRNGFVQESDGAMVRQPKKETPSATAFEAKKAKAQQIARTNASTAFDQLGEYGGDLDAALDSYRTNMADTLVEEGFKEGDDWDALLNAADRAFDAEVNKQKGTPSATTPTEAKQAKEEGAAAPTEGTEVAEFATTTEPPKVVKQPSGKNAAGESVKTLELSNGDKVQIIRRDNMWVREDDGVVTPVGKTLRDAIANVTGVAAEPLAKRGPKPKLTQEERATKAAEKKDWTSVLNFLERLITSTKKRVDTGEEGLAVQLDRFFGPRPETPEGPRKTYQTLFEERTLDNILKSKTSNPEALAVLRKNFYESIYPALEVLYDLSTRPQLATTRIKGMAEAQFNRAPVDIRNLIKTRVEGARAAPAPDIEQKITELAEEAPPVQTAQPTGPAPVVTVKKKKRVLEKPEGPTAPLSQVETGEDSTSAEVNKNFEKRKPRNGREAAQLIATDRNSTDFERTLAQKLASTLGAVRFVIVDAASNSALLNAFRSRKSKGLFFPQTSMPLSQADRAALERGEFPRDILRVPHIYVAGTNIGGEQGVNNQTVLHELLHAATAIKISQGKDILASDPKSSDPRVLAYRKLVRLMDATRKAVDNIQKNAPKSVEAYLAKSLDRTFTKGKALFDVNEFLAYGMTDPDFQAFLKTVPFEKTTVSKGFVATIRQLFGLNKNDESALAGLIDATNTLLEFKPDTAAAVQTVEALSQKQDVQTAAEVQVKYANDVIRTPRSQGPSVSLLDQAIANGMDVSSQAELAGAVAEGAMSGARKHILGAFTPSQLAKLVAEKVPALTRVVDLGRKFNAKRQQYLDEMKKTMKPWLKLQRNDREQSQLLATLMHLATVNGIDPSIPANKRVASTPQSDTLDDLWEKLGEPAREIYIDVRDYYAKQYDRYKDLLKKRIETMGISDEEKTKFMDLLKKQFEAGNVAQPYFPLMRYGENWLRVGTGKDMEFYMFESASERNRFAIRRAKEMGKPLKDLYADGTLKRGDQLKNMMEESFADTTKLKEVLAAVDKLGIDTDKASIKDEIYQMYLLTLPEKSFRKQFIHRKNTAGFSADALRNFGTAGFRMSNQLAKMEYQPQIVNTLDEARESIKDDPDASKYRTYIEEVADDFDAAVNPKNENSILNFAANGLSTLNFFYYMSSISSALTNMTSLPVFGYPTLLAEYGKTPGGAKDVHKELVRFMNIYKEVGFRRKGGDKDRIEKIKNSDLSPEEKNKRILEEKRKIEYVMPSIRMALTDADEIKAYDEFAADNLFSFNRSMDLLNIVKSPSQQATNPNILKVPVQKATDLVSGIFSMTEQLPREMMAMAAYRLGRSQGLSHDEATKKALDLTHDAMYDYSMFDTPRYFRGPVGRTIFQFKKFSQNTAFYLTTNFLQIFKGADPTIRKQAATRFFGTLGMTGMFAGLTGMPLYTVMSTVAEKVLSAFGDDDDDEDSAAFQIRKYGFDLWFKKWLSENFGANVATYVAMGPVTGLTGADFNSRVKLNDLFFQDWEFKGLLGPSFGMFENAQRAYDRFKEGQTERAIETMMPAFIRQGLKAYRFSEEGVKTPKGYEVVAKEDLDWMDIAMQGIGYSPIKVSMKQSENYKLKKLEQEREEERTELLKRSVYARRGISDEDPDDIQEDIDKFNSKFPNRRILPSTIMQSDQARRRQERAVDQGLYIANPMNRRELLELRAKE